MSGNNAVANIESQTHAWKATVIHIAPTMEAVKQMRQICRRDTNPVICDLYMYTVVIFPERHSDRPTIGAILHCILDQIIQYLCNPQRIVAPDDGATRLHDTGMEC